MFCRIRLTGVGDAALFFQAIFSGNQATDRFGIGDGDRFAVEQLVECGFEFLGT